jgi:hypothetical protein
MPGPIGASICSPRSGLGNRFHSVQRPIIPALSVRDSRAKPLRQRHHVEFVPPTVTMHA